MADLDNDLSRRLSRLAAAVPTTRLDPAHVRAVEARQRVRMAWVTPLVALVVVVVGATLLSGGSQFGPETISESDRSGDFELTIRSAKASYSADEPIVIEASLLYDGTEGSVSIIHGGGAEGGPLGFGTEEPVIGSLRLGTVFDQARHGTDLERGHPHTVPFTKGAGWFGNDPLIDQYTDYLMDPVLHLPPGTWHLWAATEFEGPKGRVTLRATIEIVVTPAETSGPAEATPFTNGPVTDSENSGPFVLAMRSAKERYQPGEPIEITAALTYVGADGSIDIRHASGARGSPLGFGIEEPVLGDLRLGPGWDLSCVSTTLHAGIPVDQEFMKTSGWSSDDPRAAEYHEFIVSTGLRLPAGTWHVYAVAEFSVGDCGADPIKLRVDLAIEVGDAEPEPSAPSTAPSTGPDGSASPLESDRSVLSVATDGLFELRLRAVSGTGFSAHAPIDLFTTYAYVGIELPGSVTVGHFQPEIAFAIEQLGVEGNVIRSKVYDSSCSERELVPGVPASVPFSDGNLMSVVAVTVGGSFNAALEDGYLSLPVGRWRITAYLDTYQGGCQARSEAGHHTLETSIQIDVRATQPGLVSRAADGGFELMLAAARRSFEKDEPIDVQWSVVNADHPGAPQVLARVPLIAFSAREVSGSRHVEAQLGDEPSCGMFGLWTQGDPLRGSFEDSADLSNWSDPAFVREVPEQDADDVYLPAGTWILSGTTRIFDWRCEATVADLMVEITISILP